MRGGPLLDGAPHRRQPVLSADAVPADLVAEARLLGAVLHDPRDMESMVDWVRADFFWKPVHRQLWETLERLWQRGEALEFRNGYECWDHYAVRDALDVDGGDELLFDLIAERTITPTGVATTLEGLAYRRRIVEAVRALGRLVDRHESPDELSVEVTTALGGLQPPVRSLTGVSGWELLAENESEDPWVIPGVVRAGWRVIVVAPEGKGKSLLLRQLSVATAAGVHPFVHSPIEAHRVLLVDLENPRSQMRRSMRAMLKIAGGADRLWLVHEPAGLNLRIPNQRGRLEAELRKFRPDLVCLGPLYKAYQRLDRHESDEEAAMDVQHAFDVLRERFGCALVFEHHAPHGGGHRDMRPFGSSAWLRWPEVGLSMEPSTERNAPDGAMAMRRFRGDRDENSWPNRLDRSKPWPWEGYWSGGVPDLS